MIGKEQKTSSENLLGDLPDDECKDMMQIHNRTTGTDWL
jgi:hypothetical protein